MLNLLVIVNRFEFKLFCWCLIVFENVHSTIEYDLFFLDSHQTEKKMSLETCLGQFDVHGNTIIRTGESQAIGGKFLQGLELETAEKCKRLCCETADCDVYVFEEKNYGYCYLFQCGSHKNFHCKFTRHSNYTSALLTDFKSVQTNTPTPSIHLPLVNMSTQEQELINLKAKPETYSTIHTVVPIKNNLVGALSAERRYLSCGRFEFPCHSGECIAVYNACNGIPQCVDGSDEGPECIEAKKNKININYQAMKNSEIQEVPNYRHNFNGIVKTPIQEISAVENIQPIDVKDQNQQIKLPNQLDTTTILGSKIGSGKLLQNHKEIYENAPEIKNALPAPQVKAHNLNESSSLQTQQRQQYDIITGAPQYSSYNQPSNSNSRKNHMHQMHMGITINENSKINSDYSQLMPTFQNETRNVDKNSEYADYLGKTMENSKNFTKDEFSIPLNSANKQIQPAFVEQFKVIEQHLEIKFTEHDGHSEKPKGAVLSLILGLMITGVIIILIGCRLRNVGRRGSRHGGKVPHIPEEDFLVNGMYL